MLMAFADDALPPEESAAIARYLEKDADARALVDAFRQSRARLGAALPIEAFEREVDPLAEAILSGSNDRSRDDGASSAKMAGGPIAQPAPRRSDGWQRFAGSSGGRRSFVRMDRFAVPLAASIALMVGVIGGYAIRGPSGDPPPETGSIASNDIGIGIGQLAGTSPVAAFLETAATGDALALDGATSSEDAAALVLAGTFIASDGRPCREFEHVAGGQDGLPTAAAVACRSADGVWSIEGAIHLAASQQTEATGIEPASGLGGGVTEAAVLEAMVNMLGASAILTPEEERALLDRGWSKSP